jgi:hypothetical protein
LVARRLGPSRDGIRRWPAAAPPGAPRSGHEIHT